MSPKTLLVAAAVLTASAAAAVPALSDTATPPAATPPAAAAPMTPDHPLPFRAQILFNLVDTNGDGSIDANEFAAFEKAVFGAIDTDHDGKLTVAEFERLAGGMGGGFGGGPGMRPAFQGKPMARFMHMRHWGPGAPGVGGPDGQGGPLHQGMLDDGQQPGVEQGGQPQNFASLDKNGDGVITPDEFSAGAPNLLGGQPPAPPAPPAPPSDQQQQ